MLDLDEALDPTKKEPEAIHRKKMKAMRLSRMPPTTTFTLRAYVFSGTEVPGFLSKRHVGDNRALGGRVGRCGRLLSVCQSVSGLTCCWVSGKMACRVSIGPYMMKSARKPNKKGEVLWSELLEQQGLVFPEDPSQVSEGVGEREG